MEHSNNVQDFCSRVHNIFHFSRSRKKIREKCKLLRDSPDSQSGNVCIMAELDSRCLDI